MGKTPRRSLRRADSATEGSGHDVAVGSPAALCALIERQLARSISHGGLLRKSVAAAHLAGVEDLGQCLAAAYVALVAVRDNLGKETP